jgi:hypothetical protein
MTFEMPLSPMTGDAPAREPTKPARAMEIDEAVFHRDFQRRPFQFTHRLGGHPLFELSALAAFAAEHHKTRVEYNLGNIPVNIPDWRLTPQNGLSAEETVRRIEECNSWMILKRAESDGRYKAVLDQCLDEVFAWSEQHEPGMTAREAAMFVSSPGSVTAYHIDHEMNFLLQMRGTKTIYVWDPEDREVLSEQRLEEYFFNDSVHRYQPYEDRFMERAQAFVLRPGEGVHVPSCAPHWVKNGPEVSVSFSAAYSTDASRRRGSVYRTNAWLRRKGMEPAPFGKYPLLDSAKAHACRAVSKAMVAMKIEGAYDYYHDH